MTDAQWLFEAEALKRKEEALRDTQLAIYKASTRALRDTLIGVLGLSLFARESGANDGVNDGANPDTPPPFIPAVLLFGNHHLLQGQMKEKEKESQEADAMSDEAFDAFSAKLAAGDYSDLEPLDFDPSPGNYWNTEGGRAALAKLGIRPRDPSASPVEHFGLGTSEDANATATTPDLQSGVFVED